MKKLAKIVALALLMVPMCFACESLTGELEEVASPDTELFTLDGGGEHDGDDLPDEPFGSN